jgi:hypothetical protein
MINELAKRFARIMSQIHSIHPVVKPEAPPSVPISPPYLTEEQLAAALFVTRRTIREWRERAYIPYLKVRGILRFDLAAVRKALESKFTIHSVHVPKRRKPRRANKQKP